MKRILKGFQEIDRIYFEFEDRFIDFLYDEITSFYPEFKYNDSSNSEFRHFSNQTFNTVESIIDKDQNYPIYRMRKELYVMQQLANKKDQTNNDTRFFIVISKQVKKIAIEFFPGIYNLSGNGLRLLDANLNYITYLFLEWFFNNNKSDS